MMTVGSLFAGVGGMDLGFQRTGVFRIVWQVENDRYARKVLERHWPEVKRHDDVRTFADNPVDILAGGDPCPVRSRARAGRASRSPNLSGYFLAVVGRLRPRWVVRENVPAPDAIGFAVCLELLGYRTSSLTLDSRHFTGQSRRRQFLCACLDHDTTRRFERSVLESCDGLGFSPSSSEEETPVAACLTAHPCRLAAEDTYCYELGRGLRFLSSEEQERLQGFPHGWTAEVPQRHRRRLLGNAVTVDVVEWIASHLAAVDGSP